MLRMMHRFLKNNERRLRHLSLNFEVISSGAFVGLIERLTILAPMLHTIDHERLLDAEELIHSLSRIKFLQKLVLFGPHHLNEAFSARDSSLRQEIYRRCRGIEFIYVDDCLSPNGEGMDVINRKSASGMAKKSLCGFLLCLILLCNCIYICLNS